MTNAKPQADIALNFVDLERYPVNAFPVWRIVHYRKLSPRLMP